MLPSQRKDIRDIVDRYRADCVKKLRELESGGSSSFSKENRSHIMKECMFEIETDLTNEVLRSIEHAMPQQGQGYEKRTHDRAIANVAKIKEEMMVRARELYALLIDKRRRKKKC